MTGIRKFGRRCVVALGLGIGLAGLAGCQGSSLTTPSQSGGNSGQPSGGPTFAEFSDLPIPTNSKIDLDRTLVLGSDNTWIGRLVLNSGHPVTNLYDFYRREMPRFGWHEVTVVRAAISVLVYQMGTRVATIKLQPGSLQGATVDVTVSPKGGNGQS